ncbi:MAG TPA: hypothetical protein VMG30_11585 [Acidobacteriota bacterium]|nr:hypothetical protein [Acidobacteriota bacterium]
MFLKAAATGRTPKANHVESEKIIGILRETGPLTGWQLLEKSGLEALPLWQSCRQTPEIHCECAGKRYLRLDRNVEGYARLSPSIRREFLTYTVLGLKEQTVEIAAMAQRLSQDVEQISRAKYNLARDSMVSIVESLPVWKSIEESVCFIIAGDVTYGMAHAVPRPEISTGKMVRGSDLDIVVIAEDEVPKAALKDLDQAIYRKKHYLLVHPNYHEEIDYLVKDISKVRRQLAFDSFQHMIASKIINEGEWLCGSSGVFRKIKAMVEEARVPEKIVAMESQAAEDRKRAEISLLQADASTANAPFLNLFYTSEEGDEIY